MALNTLTPSHRALDKIARGTALRMNVNNIIRI